MRLLHMTENCKFYFVSKFKADSNVLFQRPWYRTGESSCGERVRNGGYEGIQGLFVPFQSGCWLKSSFGHSNSGPTCKKMMNLTPAKVFKSSAFQPSDEELEDSLRVRHRAIEPASSDENMRSLSPTPLPKRKVRRLDDSDDELPDMSQLLAERRGGRSVKQKRLFMEEEEEESEGGDEDTNGVLRMKGTVMGVRIILIA
jgi:hypothetical protein